MYLDVMASLVQRLNGAGVLATSDPVEAANNRPCLLVVPPTVDYAVGTYTEPELQHRVIALSGHPLWNLDSATDLDALLEHAAPLLPELQRAEPSLYQLNRTDGQQIPCYVLTLTTL